MINSAPWTTVLLGTCCAALLTACATTEMYGSDTEASTYTQTQPREPVKLDKDSGTDMNQIAASDGTILTPQIRPAVVVDAEQLTVDQLKAYADRCGPEAIVPPPAGLDCSQIELRMQRLSSNDDEVRDALITLDRLGRNDMKSVENDLKQGETRYSMESQAIAGGLLDPTPPPPPQEESVDDILLDNGLADAIGTIIAQQ